VGGNDAKSFNWEDTINMKESQNIEWKELKISISNGYAVLQMQTEEHYILVKMIKEK
jgi:hypothetical protein